MDLIDQDERYKDHVIMSPGSLSQIEMNPSSDLKELNSLSKDKEYVRRNNDIEIEEMMQLLMEKSISM